MVCGVYLNYIFSVYSPLTVIIYIGVVDFYGRIALAEDAQSIVCWCRSGGPAVKGDVVGSKPSLWMWSPMVAPTIIGVSQIMVFIHDSIIFHMLIHIYGSIRPIQ